MKTLREFKIELIRAVLIDWYSTSPDRRIDLPTRIVDKLWVAEILWDQYRHEASLETASSESARVL